MSDEQKAARVAALAEAGQDATMDAQEPREAPAGRKPQQEPEKPQRPAESPGKGI
jgi:hypothetical protein